MDASSQFLLTIGGLLLIGLFASALADRTFLPRVTFLLIFGAIIGPEALNVIPQFFTDRFEIITEMTLLMVGFLLGGKLTMDSLRKSAGDVFWISLCAALLTAVLVCIALLLFGVAVEIAVLLGCIASATAPAPILDIIEESGAKGRFSTLLLSVVAIDDVWALVLFGFGMALVSSLNGAAVEGFYLAIVGREIIGAVLLGLIIGVPAAYLTGRVKPGQPILIEALALVFICGGLATWLEVSYLIATMVMGALITNLARHHDYPFHAIEGIESPFMVIFFVLAGASLELSALSNIGGVVIVFLVSRTLGKFFGANVGARLSGADSVTRQWIGLALLPQAGVAIGMSLVAANQFPEYRQLILPLIISATILFEIIGPVFTRLSLKKADNPRH